MEVKTTVSESSKIEVLKPYPSYRIQLNPLKIMKLESDFEIKPKKKNGVLYYRLEKDDRAAHHVVAAHYLDYEEGDKVKFKKKDEAMEASEYYHPDNLIVEKLKRKGKVPEDEWNESESEHSNEEFIDPRDIYVESVYTMDNFQNDHKTVSKNDNIQKTISQIRSLVCKVGPKFMIRLSSDKTLLFDDQYILYEKLNFCNFTLCGMKGGNKVKMSFSEFFKHYRLDDQNMANYQSIKQFKNWKNIMKARTLVYDEEIGKKMESEYMKLAVNKEAMKRMFDDLSEKVIDQQVYQRMFVLIGKGKEGKTLLTRFIGSMFPSDNFITVSDKMVRKDKFNEYMNVSYVNLTEFTINNEIDSVEFTSLFKMFVDAQYSSRGMHKGYEQIERRCLLSMTTNDTTLGTFLRSKYRQHEFETSIWSKVQPIMMERNDKSDHILKLEKMLKNDSFELGWQLTEYFKRREICVDSEVRAIKCDLKDQLFRDYNSSVDIAVLDEMPKILSIMTTRDQNAKEKWLISNRDSVFVERQAILRVVGGKVIEERLADRLRNQGFIGPMQHDGSRNPRFRISGYRINRRDAEVLFERYNCMDDDMDEIDDANTICGIVDEKMDDDW